jgi:small subunit ribosomal protein S1
VDGQQVGSPPLRKPGTVTGDLATGEMVEGTVKRITDFGAFVDVGVGRDGMVHISDLQLGSVEKVSDVVKEGQKVTVWVKEVDAKKNRISLTMVNPDRTKISDLAAGAAVEGTVTRLVPYGAFVDIGSEREAMIHVKEMANDYVKSPSDVMKPGDRINARILTVDKRRRRIDLTMKTEPEQVESAPQQVLEALAAQEDAEDLPTLMELRLKEAMDRQERRERKAKKRRERLARTDEQDDIISRTLETHRGEA